MGRIHTRLKTNTISKFKKKQHKIFLKEFGFGDIIPKLEKSPGFWSVLDRKSVTHEFFPEDRNIPPHTVEEIKEQFNFFTNDFTVDFKLQDKEVSAHMAMNTFRSLYRAVTLVFNEGTLVRKRFSNFLETYDLSENSEKMCTRMVQAASVACMVSSSLDGYVYGFHLDSKQCRDSEGWTLFHNNWGIIRRKAIKKTVSVNSKKRLCYEVLMSKGVETFYTQTIQWEGKEYPLYIQSHALQRSMERLNLESFKRSYTMLRMHANYDDIFLYRDKILIPAVEDIDMNNRVGYYLCELGEEECVIITFLFISQSGTPEGDLLSEKLTIDKNAKNYLEMDNYDHFVKSDLRDDETIRSICRECNLDHLFDIDEGVTNRLSGNASFIKETLQLDDVMS